MTITVYTFEDKGGYEYGSFRTQDYKEARSYALANNVKVIGNTFEWTDSELVDDFTLPDEEESTNE